MLRCFSAAASVLILCNALMSDDALAWGASGQRMIGELGAQSLPAEIPSFLRTPEAARQIAEVAREADRFTSLDAAHFVEVGDDLKISRGPSLAALPANREGYDSALRVAGTNQYRAGYLPYAIIEAWQQLVVDFAYWRADIAGVKYVRSPSEQTWFFRDEHIREGLTIRDIGYLAHFVADGSHPLHVSVHRDGWGNYPNPQRFSSAKDVLARFDGAVVRSRITEKDISALMAPYRDCRCGIERRVAGYLAATQKDVTTLYGIEKSGGFDGRQESGKAFASKRLAAGASELRDLIVDAWRRSAEVSIGYPPVAVRDIESGKINALNVLQGVD